MNPPTDPWYASRSQQISITTSIDAHLASIEQTQNKLGRCIDNNNHRGRMSLTTGHWNDNTTR